MRMQYKLNDRPQNCLITRLIERERKKREPSVRVSVNVNEQTRGIRYYTHTQLNIAKMHGEK